MTMAAWVSNPQKYVRIRPGIKISAVTDSIGAPQTSGGWQQEVQNYCALRYGDSQPTWFNRGVGGVDIQTATSDGQLASAIADNPDVIMIELGVNNMLVYEQAKAGGTFNAATCQSDIYAAASTMLSTIRASLPNCMIGWVNIAFGRGEGWGASAARGNTDIVNAINAGIAQAAAQYSAQYIEQTSMFQVQDQAWNTQNTSPGTPQPLTVDGTHPNYFGRPMMGTWIRDGVRWDATLYPDTSKDPTWLPNADVTPFVWLEADSLAPGSVTSWGGFGASGLSGATVPTCVAGGWFTGKPVVRFNGTTDVLTASGLSVPAGAKTMFYVYRPRTQPSVFNDFQSLATVRAGTLSTEFIPVANASWSPPMWMTNDPNHPDGFFLVSYPGVGASDGPLIPTRMSFTWTGGSTTDPAQYTAKWGGCIVTSAQSSSFLAQSAVSLNAIGARVSDGVTPTNFAAVDLAAIIGYPGVLSTVQWARVDQYLRRKWGP